MAGRFIPVSAPETFLLAKNVENLPVTERSALLGRFQGAAGTWAAAGLAASIKCYPHPTRVWEGAWLREKLLQKLEPYGVAGR